MIIKHIGVDDFMINNYKNLINDYLNLFILLQKLQPEINISANVMIP